MRDHSFWDIYKVKVIYNGGKFWAGASWISWILDCLILPDQGIKAPICFQDEIYTFNQIFTIFIEKLQPKCDPISTDHNLSGSDTD